MPKEICPNCHKEVEPRLYSTGHAWVDMDGSATDNFKDHLRCPACGEDFPEPAPTPIPAINDDPPPF